MALHLSDSLLALAAAIDGDGGHGVCRTLATLLRDAAPFDGGEVVLRQEQGFHRFPFGGDGGPVAGDDVLKQVLANGAPLRLDDQRDLEAFPETRDRMTLSGWKSAIFLPLGTVIHVPGPVQGPSPNGVLALGRRHGWAFVGASLNFLGPLAAMAGLALDRSLALTALGHPAGREAGADLERREGLRREGANLMGDLQRLRADCEANAREVETLRASLAVARDELADARGAAIAAQSALDQAVGRCRELQARLDRERLPTSVDEGAREEPAPEVGAAIASPDATAPPPAASPSSSRRARRRRRGAFEPSGGAGAA